MRLGRVGWLAPALHPGIRSCACGPSWRDPQATGTAAWRAAPGFARRASSRHPFLAPGRGGHGLQVTGTAGDSGDGRLRAVLHLGTRSCAPGPAGATIRSLRSQVAPPAGPCACRCLGSPCGQTRAQPVTKPDGTLASRATRWTLRSSLPRGALAQATRSGLNARPDGDARVGSTQVAADGGKACACALRTRLRGCGHRVAAALVRVVYASLQVATSLRSLPQMCAALLRLILHWPEKQVVSLRKLQLWRNAALLAREAGCEFHVSARAGGIDQFVRRILPQRAFVTTSRLRKSSRQTHNLCFCPRKDVFARVAPLLAPVQEKAAEAVHFFRNCNYRLDATRAS